MNLVCAAGRLGEKVEIGLASLPTPLSSQGFLTGRLGELENATQVARTRYRAQNSTSGALHHSGLLKQQKKTNVDTAKEKGRSQSLKIGGGVYIDPGSETGSRSPLPQPLDLLYGSLTLPVEQPAQI